MNTQTIRQVLATRLREWMNRTPELGVQEAVKKKSGVSQATIQRVLAADAATNIEVVEKLAFAFGRTTAELLESPETGGIRYDRKAYAQLSQPEKEGIERYIAFVISGALQHQSVASTPPADKEQARKSAYRPASTTTLNFNNKNESTERKQRRTDTV